MADPQRACSLRNERNGATPRRPATRPAIGQPFDPQPDACGFYPPDVVGRQTDLTDGQKRLYERGVRWSGRNGMFWYSFETMAVELGKSPRQVKRDMAELERRALIAHERRGKRQSNMYRFLYHPMFDGEVTSTSHHRVGEVPDLPGEVTPTSLGDVTLASHELYKENLVRESSSRDSATAADSANKPIDDETLSVEQETKQNLDVATVIGFASAPGDEDPLMGTGPLPRWFLEAAAGKIHASKCSYGFGDVDLTLHPRPDLSITTKIAEPWRGKGTAAFADWLYSTVERRLGRKGKAGGPYVYGLFLTDSLASASGWEPNSTMSKVASMHIADLKRRADQREAEEQLQALMETPIPLEHAVRTLTTHARDDKPLNPRFIWLMAKRVELISPGDLRIAANGWQPCRTCKNVGIFGSALKRTLAFCECDIGQQERLDRGDDYIRDEIRRVHADFKSKLVQACRELRLDFTGDSLEREQTEIVEHDRLVEIRPVPDWHICCNQQDIEKCLQYVGDRRRVRVIVAMESAQPPREQRSNRPIGPPITQEDIDRVLAGRFRKMPERIETSVAAGGGRTA